MNTIKRHIFILFVLCILLFPACNRDVGFSEEEKAINPPDKTTLKLAGIGLSESPVRILVNEFNKEHTQYEISLVDYSRDDTGIQKLHTELVSGAGPDLLLLDGLNPAAYAEQGFLLDLYPLLHTDSILRQEDIAIRNALCMDGSMFLLAPNFSIKTMSTCTDTLLRQDSWTISEYLDVRDSLEAWQTMVYYMSPIYFIEEIGRQYIRGALDYENASCDFYNETFIRLLEASAEMETYDSSLSEFESSGENFKTAWQRKADGQLISGAEWIDSVDDISFNRFMFGDRSANYIGFPTTDGSNGAYAVLFLPIGICTQTEYSQGCWEFIRYLMTHPLADHGLPAYLPELRREIAAFDTGTAPFSIEQTDIDLMLELALRCTQTNFYDETVMDIILEETEPLFAGAATPEEAAKRIQDRVSLYLAEQYG